LKHIVTIKFGDKFDHTYVNNLYRSILFYYKEPFTFYCLTDNKTGLDAGVVVLYPKDFELVHKEPHESHWNRFLFFKSGVFPDGDIITLDIDQIFIGDMSDIFNNVEDDFVGLHRWWSLSSHDFSVFGRRHLIESTQQIDTFFKTLTEQDKAKLNNTINGGFYMFKANTDLMHSIYKEFMVYPRYFINYWTSKGLLKPGHGEQNFVNSMLLSRKETICTLPKDCAVRFPLGEQEKILDAYVYKKIFNKELYNGDEFNDDIKLVHFTRSEDPKMKHISDAVKKHWRGDD
jgi:hypothetical protein